MIEVLIGIILVPVALCDVAFTVALGIGFVKALKRKK